MSKDILATIGIFIANAFIAVQLVGVQPLERLALIRTRLIRLRSQSAKANTVALEKLLEIFILRLSRAKLVMNC